MGDPHKNLGKAVNAVKLLRPVFLIGGLVMNLFGVALASHSGSYVDWAALVYFQLILVTLQLSGHAANDYADFESDAVNANRTWFSGGSGILPSGKISKSTAVRLSAIFAALTLLESIIFFMTFSGDVTVLFLILIGLAGALQYSLGPLRLSYRGLGEAFMMFLYGSICADAAFMVQFGAWDNVVLVATMPLMVQVLILMLLTEYPDFEADSAAGKRNLVVRLGRRNSRMISMSLLPAGALISLLGSFGGMSDMNVIAVAVIFAIEAVVIAVIMRMLQSSKLSYNWLTSASVGFLLLLVLISALTF